MTEPTGLKEIKDIKKGLIAVGVLVLILFVFFCGYFYKDGFRNGYLQAETDNACKLTLEN
jgi:hypothetical protein